MPRVILLILLAVVSASSVADYDWGAVNQGLQFYSLLEAEKAAQQALKIYIIVAIIVGLINLALCFAVAGFAKKRGYSYLGFFLLSFFFSVIIGFIVALLMPANASMTEQAQHQSGDRRKCPFCAEWVASEAKICKHCQRDLPVIVPSAQVERDVQSAVTAQAERETQAAARAQAIKSEPLSELQIKHIKQAVLFVFFTIIAIFGYNAFENKKIVEREQQAKAARVTAIGSNMIRIPGKNYEMGKYEVTQGEWRAVMGNNPSHFIICGDACPVERVSWNDAQEFIEKLNNETGKQYRLPTEAEWEYACYGGSKTEYCGGNDVDSVAWYDKNSGDKTYPAGQKQANGYGLYDMSGNVWEWQSDCYDGDCAVRVLRGGSWNSGPLGARAAIRDGVEPAIRHFIIGFRLARMLP
jgi:formylglycine-generating enzyme required for sulfatase activity